MSKKISKPYEDFPIFAKEEQGMFKKFSRGKTIPELGKLVLSIKNAESTGSVVEQVASVFLITNLLLMSKASRRITKLVALESEEKDDGAIFPIINSLRYLLTDEHSRLDNYNVWKNDLKSISELTEPMERRLLEISDFLTNSELSHATASQQKAETLFTFQSSKRAENQGISVDVSNPFFVSFKNADEEYTEVVSQGVFRDSFSIKTSHSGDVVVIEIDGENSTDAVKGWMDCLERLCHNNLLGLDV